jgi:hypothetical protein
MSSMHIKMTQLIHEFLCESLDELKGKRIHLSHNEIKNVRTVDPSSTGVKPMGLYYTLGDLWVDWIRHEPKRLYGSKYIYEVIFSPDARIWAPKTYEDYYQITTKYAQSPEKLPWKDDIWIDYGKMSNDFDGLEIFEENAYDVATSKTPEFGWVGELCEPLQGVVWNGNVTELKRLDVSPEYLHQVKMKRYDPTGTGNTEYSYDDYINNKVPKAPVWSNSRQCYVDADSGISISKL